MVSDFVCACLIAFVYSFGYFPKGGYNTFSPHAAICMLFMKNKNGKGTSY